MLQFALDRYLAAAGSDRISRLFDITTDRRGAVLAGSDVVQPLWFSNGAKEVRITDRDGAALIPNMHVKQIVNGALR